MSKNQLLAQVIFEKHEITKQDGYAVNIYDREYKQYMLDTWYPCVAKENADGATDFVHWHILRKITQLQELGYKIDFRC